jgi:hypothetical protein
LVKITCSPLLDYFDGNSHWTGLYLPVSDRVLKELITIMIEEILKELFFALPTNLGI